MNIEPEPASQWATKKELSLALVFAVSLLLVACDNKPPHYYVWCDQTDGAGWNLIDSVKVDGYLMSCTYQSPDKRHIRKNQCRKTGCD